MDKEQNQVHILIINDDFEEVDTIKSWLDKEMRIPWHYTHCINMEEAKSRVKNSDLIILKPETEKLSSPIQAFKDIKDIVFETPIIVLAGMEEDEHELSTIVMEKGAADVIIRGKFGRLVDAIEFALIRQKITTATRQTNAVTFQDSKDKATKKLQDSRNKRIKDKDEATVKLQDSNDQRVKEQAENKQLLSTLMGDNYSASSSKKEK